MGLRGVPDNAETRNHHTAGTAEAAADSEQQDFLDYQRRVEQRDRLVKRRTPLYFAFIYKAHGTLRRTTASISAAKLRANHVPRGVSRAEARLPIMVTVNIPSRARSAMVMPYIRAPQALGGDPVHTPRLL
jgi:hypothetical protein